MCAHARARTCTCMCACVTLKCMYVYICLQRYLPAVLARRGRGVRASDDGQPSPAEWEREGRSETETGLGRDLGEELEVAQLHTSSCVTPSCTTAASPNDSPRRQHLVSMGQASREGGGMGTSNLPDDILGDHDIVPDMSPLRQQSNGGCLEGSVWGHASEHCGEEVAVAATPHAVWHLTPKP